MTFYKDEEMFRQSMYEASKCGSKAEVMMERIVYAGHLFFTQNLSVPHEKGKTTLI